MLERWRERNVFLESVRRREGSPTWVFYEGPPTANAPPGSHHVLARAFKDIFPRYKTMCGFYVERKGCWDCHGLPVELAVEAELGFTSKSDIERYGIAEFNAICREKVMSHVADWARMVERVGHWIDLEHPYKTMDPEYVESVWWALKTIHQKGLLYEKLKVVPYCPRDQVTLSSHELGQPDVYRDVIDPSVYFGHREMDLAMMKLFGGFERATFDAYEEALPLAAGHERRVALHQLYPLVVHVNLFGHGYVGQLESALEESVLRS